MGSGEVNGETLAAAAMVSAANRRAIEVRAEAAMLVEAVEDRAASVRLDFISGIHPEAVGGTGSDISKLTTPCPEKLQNWAAGCLRGFTGVRRLMNGFGA